MVVPVLLPAAALLIHSFGQAQEKAAEERLAAEKRLAERLAERLVDLLELLAPPLETIILYYIIDFF